ncbi:MAG: DUF998 domain-containing protein [Candidatus Thorarchaeota archaeon]|nr:DUF998 domain-containing protein [Candidatus Thorarchaeota archaeon]
MGLLAGGFMSLSEKIQEAPKPIFMAAIAPLFALTCIAIAILISPDFSWTGNALSDLGHYIRTDIGPNPVVRAIIFNVGLTVTGIVMVYYIIWLFRQLNDLPTKIGIIPYVIASVFLTAIGIFSENFSPTHYIVSVGFFFSFPWAMWFIGLSWLRFRKLWWFALISLALPFISIYLWWGTFAGVMPWTGVALPEILTSLTAIMWIWGFVYLQHTGKLANIIK